MTGLTIGKVATGASVGIETIRFYERKGLLAPPPRNASGYRLYPADTVARLRFIGNAKDLGFSLKEISELLALQHSPASTKADIKQRAEAKVREIDEKIAALKKIRHDLSTLAASCSGQGSVDDCPILEALEGKKSVCKC